MSDLYIITGANGAGKSSVGSIYTLNIDSVFDGDKLFMQQRSEFWKKGISSNKVGDLLKKLSNLHSIL